MIKMVFCLKRLPKLTLEEFQSYWRDKHAPLVAERAPLLNVRRYVQVHTVPHEINPSMQKLRQSPDSFDGVAELWWDSISDLLAATSTDEGRAAYEELIEDERRFIDLAQSPIWIGVENQVVG